MHIECGDLKKRTCTFGIGTSNYWCVDIVKALIVVVLMNGIRHGMPNAQNSTKGICARPKVCNFSKEFKAMPLLLKGEC